MCLLAGSKQARTEKGPPSAARLLAPTEGLASILSALEAIKAEVAAIKHSQFAIISEQQHLSTQVTAMNETQRHVSNQVQQLVNHTKKFYTRLHDLPLEIIDQIFAWIPVRAVLQYRQLSKTMNKHVLTTQFAMLNLCKPDFREESECSLTRLWLVLPEPHQAVIAREMAGKVTSSTGCEFDQVKKRLPESLSSLTAAESIELVGCKLIGNIPDIFGPLGSLSSLDLSKNSLMGPLPSSFSLLTGLRQQDLSDNQLSGEFPALPNSNLKGVYIARNQFKGGIPTMFGSPSRLITLHAQHNCFSVIPASIGQLTCLKELCIHGNHISSEIPPELWNLQALKQLFMRHCGMFGSIAGIGALRNVKSLQLSNNHFSGVIPSSQFYRLQRLETINLQGNQFSGCKGNLWDLTQMPNLNSLGMSRDVPRRHVKGYELLPESESEPELGSEPESESESNSDSDSDFQ
ncbi:hypothetical protein HDU78_010802 [Chytriomyces hyalinus]|nr:hypothetical protein HDU78_010802 [Chytriomyces hyalinus]